MFYLKIQDVKKINLGAFVNSSGLRNFCKFIIYYDAAGMPMRNEFKSKGRVEMQKF